MEYSEVNARNTKALKSERGIKMEREEKVKKKVTYIYKV